jgi:carboxymethylenebutenolidase
MTSNTHSIQTITALDGKSISAYVAEPQGSPKACVIIVQEIFGVNAHIRAVADDYAARGYRAIAPAFFDRIETGVELAYSSETTAKGRSLVDALGLDAPMRDIHAVQKQLSQGLACAVVGYCWGGSVAMLAASRLALPAVAYYGGRSAPYLHESLQAPVMFHFGALDAMITPDTIAAIQAARPNSHCYIYEAGHGFNRKGHPDYYPQAAELALERTLAFIDLHTSRTISAQRLVDEAGAQITTLTVAQAQAKHGADKVVFVDLRDPRELDREGVIEGAVHATRGMLEFWIDPASPYYKPVFTPDKEYILFCGGGWRSALAAKTLKEMGFLPNVAHIEGGFTDWKKSGAPIKSK